MSKKNSEKEVYGIEVQTGVVTPNQTGLDFNFSQQVEDYLIGTSNISYAFDEDDRDLLEIGLGLTGSKTGNNTVHLSSQMIMRDKKNDIGDSSLVQVHCIASYGNTANDNILMADNFNYSSGQHSSPIMLGKDTYINASVLQGFNLKYEEQHFLKKIHTHVDHSVNGKTSVTLTGTTDMSDDSGHFAENKELKGGYMGTFRRTPSCGIVTTEVELRGVPIQIVDFSKELQGKKLKKVVAMIKGFNIEFEGDDHKLLSLTAQVNSYITGPEKTSVFLTGNVQMLDDSGHIGTGGIEVLVVGIVE